MCGANQLLRDRFPNAALLDALNGAAPTVGAWGSVIVDPGEAEYAAFLVENAERVVKELPEAAGVCIDRGDYLGMMNAAADDGVSMAPGNVTGRALLVSWKETSAKIAESLHAAGKALYLNPDMGHRVDMWKHTDGLFDEIGDDPRYRTSSAWLASGGKPAVMWCHDVASVPPQEGWSDCGALMANGTDIDRDVYLQSHLVLGVHPMIGVPDNDHGLPSSPRANALHALYGPLFGELTSKRWAAEPHAVEVIADASKSARANLFERRPYGAGTWVLAVGFAAADQESAVVRVRVDGDAFSAAAVRPDGAPAGSAAVADAGPGEIDVTVPLARGAGVVVLRPARRSSP